MNDLYKLNIDIKERTYMTDFSEVSKNLVDRDMM